MQLNKIMINPTDGSGVLVPVGPVVIMLVPGEG